MEPAGKPLGAGVKERKAEDEAGESVKGQNTQSRKGHVRRLQCTLSERDYQWVWTREVGCSDFSFKRKTLIAV